MLRSLLERCGMLVGAVIPDPDLVESAEQVRDSLREWEKAIEAHRLEDIPKPPMRRVK